jgi:D-cysteine desulfhydrase
MPYRSTLPLFTRFPDTRSLPLAGIAEIPTPVDWPQAEWFEQLPIGPVWAKRDDLTGRAYGGNKVRKLDFLLGEALAKGAKSVLTFGAYGSNHALATAVHARALGLEPHVVLSPQEPGPYAPATLLAHAGLGTQLHLTEGWDGKREAVLAMRQIAERDGVEPYVIPMGGTSALGTLGYVNAALEIAEQAESPLSSFTMPDVIYVAAGTLGTAIGLAIGFAAVGSRARVEAIRVTPAEVASQRIARELVTGVVALLRSLDRRFPLLRYEDLRIRLRDDHFEPGYGVVTPQTEEAVALAAETGLNLETTYTGKAFSAMLADARSHALRTDEIVLFLDTYSSAAKPEPGRVELLPQKLQEYVEECERRFDALV